MTMSLAQARVIDPILTTQSRGYSQAGLVGDLLLPIATMPTRAAKRIEFDRSSFRRYNTKRAPGGGIAQVSFGYDGKPVSLHQHALSAKTPVEHIEDAAAVPGIDLQATAVDTVMSVIATEKEIAQAAAARNPATYSAGNRFAPAGTAKWSSDASDPGGDIDDGHETIRGRTGRRANTLLLGARVATRLRRHPKILDQFKYTNADAKASDAQLAEYFNVKQLLIGDAIFDDDDGDSVDVWGEDAILAFVPVAGLQNIRIPAYGYTYRLANHPFVQPARYEGGVRSWLNDVFDEYSPEIVGPDAGFLVQSAL